MCATRNATRNFEIDMTLHEIRLQLRGPIADSPFAGRDKRSKLAYATKQYDLHYRWMVRGGNAQVHRTQMRRWLDTKVDIIAGLL